MIGSPGLNSFLKLGWSKVFGQVGYTGAALCVDRRLMRDSRYGRCAAHALAAALHWPLFGSITGAFTLLLARSSKCRCGPVEMPELPTLPSTVPAATAVPIGSEVTELRLRCR